MTWTHYRLVFRLESPLHIGWRKTGNLMQTRRYVPGKNLWAALTERLIWLAGLGNAPQAYRCVGEYLKACFRFGYLWPTYEGRTDEWQPHFPWDEPQGPEYWDYLYLDGTARTALAPERRTAAEGMLYEIEFISPYTREGHPVYLVGDLWVQTGMPSAIDLNSSTIPLPWEQALQRLQIGGERGYGWGRIQLAECRKNAPLTWPGWAWQGHEEAVVLHPLEQEGTRLPAHALAADFTNAAGHTEQALRGIRGEVEPWLGWEYQGSFRLSIARIMYEPGARIDRAPQSGEATLHSWGYLYQTPPSSS